MKLSLIGGAGVRSIGLARALFSRLDELPVNVLCIHDTSPSRLQTIGRMIVEEARLRNVPLRVQLTEDIREAVRGADFIYLAIRQGGDRGRVIDEKIPLQYGILGQETTGPGGFAMALRTIPVMLEYARIIESEAPLSWVINFTNPAGLITEALHRHSGIRVIGICDAPSSLKLDIARFLKLSPDQIKLHYFGLNHLGWINSVTVNGEERLPYILGNYESFVQESPHMACFSPELVQSLGLLPNEYLHYYYNRNEAVARIQTGGETRGEQISRLNETLFTQLSGHVSAGRMTEAFSCYERVMQERENTYMSLESGQVRGISPAKEDGESPQGEGYAGLALGVMDAICNNRATELIVNVPNRGTLPELLPEDIVEVACLVDGKGPHPIQAGSIPAVCQPLLEQVKHYERLTISAAVSGSYEVALAALAAHPLVEEAETARLILDDYIREHGAFLSHFTKRGSGNGKI